MLHLSDHTCTIVDCLEVVHHLSVLLDEHCIAAAEKVVLCLLLLHVLVLVFALTLSLAVG